MPPENDHSPLDIQEAPKSLSISIISDIDGKTIVEVGPPVAVLSAAVMETLKAANQRKGTAMGDLEGREWASCLLRSVPDMIFFKDSGGKYLVVNQALKDFAGTKFQDPPEKEQTALPQPLDEIFSRGDREVLELRATLRFTEEAANNAGEKRSIDIIKAPVFDQSGNILGLAGVCRDITEQRREEAEARKQGRTLQARMLSLETSNQEMEDFVHSVTHDLRSPLTAIVGLSDMIGRKYAGNLDDKGREMLEVIGERATRMERLINDLLAFCRATSAEIRTSDINMNALVQDAVDELYPLTPSREVRLIVNPLPSAKGDVSMIQQVFVNLLSNAFKFTRAREIPVIEIGSEVRPHENVYFIRDNGVGFEMNKAGRLFGVFQRLHPSNEFEGTGIGLAITKKIIEKHGGRIWADAKPGEGSSFFFTLPTCNPPHNRPF